MGVDYIRECIEHLKSKSTSYNWKHGIQTNLMTFDAKWAKLYHDHFGGEVGISWDPKIRLLNKHATDSHGKFNERFTVKLKEAVSSGLTPYLVVTATKTLFESFPNPFDFFQKWKDLGVNHVHLERVTETGFARDNWLEVGLSNGEYSSFMSRWLKAYTLFKRNTENKDFFLSPFDEMNESIKSLSSDQPSGRGCWSGTCDTRFHTIDAQGYKFGCTALTSESGNKNATTQPPIINDIKQKRDLRVYNCGECRFRKICSTGCLALSFDDGSGECSGGYNLFQTAEILNKGASQ
jgi:radical SAM protein with 4Fe4S-binding SPASM domain